MSDGADKSPVSGKVVVLGVTGSIAAYKAADLTSKICQRGADVRVIMTENATRLVAPLTFESLSGYRVVTSLWNETAEHRYEHISLAEDSDAFVVAPATANILAKAAVGIADDALSTAICTIGPPIIFAPAMNFRMLANPTTRANLQRLKEMGHVIVEPEAGHLACGEEGQGRLAPIEEIIAAIERLLGKKSDLAGVGIVVTSGPTREPIDPVRFISNASSGRMGHAIAEAAVRRGARVTLISGPVPVLAPLDAEIVPVTTTQQMHDAVIEAFQQADVVIAAGAPADFAPAHNSDSKLKKAGVDTLNLELKPTPDILAELGRRKGARILVGFAAETEDLIENARSKLAAKNLDLVVANDVTQNGAGFESETNVVTLIPRDGEAIALPRMHKRLVADYILDHVGRILAERRGPSG